MARTYKPLGDRVLLQPLEEEAQTSSGIILPDSAKEKPQEGLVVAVGPGRGLDDGKRVAMGVKEGDKVIFQKYAGTEVKMGDDEEYLILSENDILAVVEEAAE
jgi:chaperonin GroES